MKLFSTISHLLSGNGVNMTNNDTQILFMEYIEPLRDRLSRFVRAISSDREEAKDIISETILITYKNFHKIRDRKALLSYLFTIASRLNNDARKRRNKFSYIDEMDYHSGFSLKSNADTLTDIEILYKMLDKLPKKMKETIVLFEISGFSLEEIKNIQGGTISGVKSRLIRSREKLKQLMTDKYSTGPKIFGLDNYETRVEEYNNTKVLTFKINS